jgi:formylglycine-generating enzyme required for sulfatase activity
VAELDQRSDIYSLGGILYAILTLRPPIEGTTLDEVLTKVKNGNISSMVTKRGGRGPVTEGAPTAMGAEVPEALQAVTLKAMATDRNTRYGSVEEFAGDIERYQNGFATQAEDAGTLKRLKLWVVRNKVLAGSAAAMMMVVSSFTAKVVAEGRRAERALARLQETAPTFATRAQDALREGNFEEALKSIEFALDLEPKNAEYHLYRGHVLQVLIRWPQAIESYRAALRFGDDRAKENLELTESLVALSKKETQEKANGALFEALNKQGRQMEALAFGKELGEFWKDRQRDAGALRELVKRLEAKLLPVPGTDVLMCSTEMTVGEWKLYLKAEALPEWTQPVKEWSQTDEHPVVCVNWIKAKALCDWLTAKTGKEWRLPLNSEWDAAVGNSKYPWGEYYPPHWDDGNYKILEDGSGDPKQIGVDGIFGTAPVASFKSNALGFYDLGGNATEWMWDPDEKTGEDITRGSSWFNYEGLSYSACRQKGRRGFSGLSHNGLRLVRKSGR